VQADADDPPEAFEDEPLIDEQSDEEPEENGGEVDALVSGPLLSGNPSLPDRKSIHRLHAIENAHSYPDARNRIRPGFSATHTTSR
jgi:hypothetical protein